MSILFATSLFFGVATSNPEPSDLHGKWSCGPYEMATKEFTAKIVDKYEYLSDGTFSSDGHAEYDFADVGKVNIQIRHFGIWKLHGSVLETKFTKAEFVSSDSNLLTVEAGQANLDVQMTDQRWTRKRILSHYPNLITIPIKPKSKLAKIKVSCSRA